ncbi:MAG: DUF411 domain-containing protein [Hyphomicrobium sp.]|jgi:hypothetical protein
MNELPSRRAALQLLGLAAATITGVPRAFADALPMVTVRKDPNCSCCTGWAEHVRAAGFPVTVIPVTDLKAIKARLGVPEDLAGCHTAEVGGYVVEGHVPADAIKRLLDEKPAAIGLAVPGMPAGSPGMGGSPEVFEVTLFRAESRQVFGRYQGADRRT